MYVFSQIKKFTSSAFSRGSELGPCDLPDLLTLFAIRTDRQGQYEEK